LPRLSSGARIALGTATAVAALVLIFLITVAGLSTWRGFGFRATGPELPRLRHVLALKAGMSVADVGAGNGELTVALATEIGSTGRVYSTDIDPKAWSASAPQSEPPGYQMSRSCTRWPTTRGCPRIAATPSSCGVSTTT
jgi:hypothetical protein